MPAGNVAKPGKTVLLPVGRVELKAREHAERVASAASPFDVAETAASPFDVQEGARAQAAAPAQEAIHTAKTRYFVITSNSAENVVKSVRHGVWATQKKNEDKFDEALKTASAVISSSQ